MIIDSGAWLWPTLGSALLLGIYDIAKKHAVRDNAVMPVLFGATLSGSCSLCLLMLWRGIDIAGAGLFEHALIFLKSLLVGSSWYCVYRAMRDLPVSLAAPIRASAPLWTFFGGMLFFHEIPGLWQGVAMLAVFVGYYLFAIFGKMEGISFRRSRGVHYIFIGTLLGAASALYDKYLLNTLAFDKNILQFYFSLYLVLILGAAWLGMRNFFPAADGRKFDFRWTIPLTGILLVAADYLYFSAVSMPEIKISVLSLVRRSSCVVTFIAGALIFHECNILRKFWALLLIAAGVVLLYYAS